VSLARVFGVLEGMHTISIAAGSVAVPLLLGWLEPRNALLVAAAWMPIVVLLASRALRRTDEAAVVHVRELELLRGLPMFASLPPPTIERLSALLTPVAVGAGQVVIRQGDPGDDFFFVDDGELDVHVDDIHRRTLGPGSGFGEIALVRNVPRTATVTARTDGRLYALSREVFLAAVAGHPEGRRATDDLVSDRLAASG
jgi:CRP-like cAMP-binding protein